MIIHRQTSRAIVPALLLALTFMLALTPSNAQEDSEENTSSSTTYDSTGTVTAISSPLTITVNSRRGPFTY